MHNVKIARLAVMAVLFASLFVAAGGRADAASEVVRFRLLKWKASHVEDSQSAEDLAKTLKDIGCEVDMHAHDGHIDVRYRCPEWKSIALKTHDDAHKWERWLKTKGFETEHKH